MLSVRILLADDHDVARIGVRILLEGNPNWRVVAEACDGQQAIEEANEFRPNIVILDFSMPRVNGLDAAREIVTNLPDTKVLMLTIYDSDPLIEEMKRAGVHGYVRKAEANHDLVCAIEALLQKKTFYPPGPISIKRRGSKIGEQMPLPPLTARQKEIIGLLAQGRTESEVAEMLGISVRTVETHMNNIHLRTNCRTMAHLVRYAIRNGLIEA